MELNNLQINILKNIEQGKKNIEIAEELGYSEVYIKKQINKLFKMFKADNRTMLCSKWIR